MTTVVPAHCDRSAVTCAPEPELLQVLASGVARTAPEALFTCTLAQSYWMVSGQTTRYQKLSCGLPEGSATACVSELSVEGLVLPTRAAYVPECAVGTTAVLPAEVQPPTVPASQPPLTTPPPVL